MTDAQAAGLDVGQEIYIASWCVGSPPKVIRAKFRGPTVAHRPDRPPYYDTSLGTSYPAERLHLDPLDARDAIAEIMGRSIARIENARIKFLTGNMKIYDKL
jgi:hypothetical protein